MDVMSLSFFPFKSPQFRVPPAVVLTLKAYEEFASVPAVQDAIEELQRATNDANHKNISRLKAASEECVETISKLRLPSSLEDLVSHCNKYYTSLITDSNEMEIVR